MRKLLGLLLCFGLCISLGFGSVGCSKKKEKEVAKKDVVKKDGGKEKIDLSAEPVTVEIKGEGTSKISAVRENYDGAIELKFSEVPKGVVIKDATIPKSKESIEVKVTVGETAEAGEHKVTVTGKGKDGSYDTKLELTIKAKKASPKKAKITLSAEPLAIKLDKDKKGKGTATISAKRENYEGDIDVKFGKAPKGVTIAKDATIAGVIVRRRQVEPSWPLCSVAYAEGSSLFNTHHALPKGGRHDDRALQQLGRVSDGAERQ